MSNRKKGNISIGIALFMWIVVQVIDRFFIQINDTLYIILMLLAIVCIGAAIYFEKTKNRNLK